MNRKSQATNLCLMTAQSFSSVFFIKTHIKFSCNIHIYMHTCAFILKRNPNSGASYYSKCDVNVCVVTNCVVGVHARPQVVHQVVTRVYIKPGAPLFLNILINTQCMPSSYHHTQLGRSACCCRLSSR